MVIAGVLLAGAASTVPTINQIRIDDQLDPGTEIGESMSPQMALATAALGSFRGLFVDILWYRANELKEEGKFFEANTLSELITTLQPRFPVVWEFHAWNMAYNISVATDTKEERWDWVNKGITLLRDKGIKYNPRAPRLYKELSWIFFHKVQGISDDAHWYYKTQVYKEWQELMGASITGATTEETIERFRAIPDAPPTLEALREQSPETGPLLDKLAVIGYDLQTAWGEQKLAERAEVLLRVLGRFAMYNFIAEPIFDEYPLINAPPELDPAKKKAVAELLLNKENIPGIKALLPFLRNIVLRVHYRMDPQFMLETMEMYGPLDWRHPCAHSLYWAREGTDMAEQLMEKDTQVEIDFLNSYRQNIYSIQELMFSGQITYDVTTNFYTAQPDPRYIESYTKARETAIQNLTRDKEKEGTIGGSKVFDPAESLAAGHENFLHQAAYYSYIWGEPEQAMKYWKQSRDLYGELPHNVRSGIYLMPMEEWVLRYMKENLDMMRNTRQFVEGALRRGFTEGLAEGNLDRWEYYDQMGRRVHREYQKNSIITNITEQDRAKLPPYGEMRADIFEQYMQHPGFHPLIRSRVWYNAPPELRAAKFGQLRQVLYAQAAAFGLRGEALFPPPPGWVPPEVLDNTPNPEDDNKPKPQVEIK